MARGKIIATKSTTESDKLTSQELTSQEKEITTDVTSEKTKEEGKKKKK